MIIKSLGHKSRNAASKLANYIFRDKASLKNAKGQPVIIKFNIKGKTIEDFIKEFNQNEKLRLHERKGVNRIFHDIISFSNKDTAKLGERAFKDFAFQYLQLRAPNCLALVGIHIDKEHSHLHLMLSGSEIITGKSIRISRDEFRSVKESLQEYQKDNYPELSASIVNHAKKVNKRLSHDEFQMKARTRKQTRKEEILSILQRAFDSSVSKAEFYQNVKAQGLTTYERGNKTMGINDNERHYRFATLGFNEEKFEKLELSENRISELNNLRGSIENENELVTNEIKMEEPLIEEKETFNGL